MVSRITTLIQQHTPAILTSLLIIVTLIIFAVLIGKHYEVDNRAITKLTRLTNGALVIAGNRIGLLDTCGEGSEFTVFSFTTYICNNPNDELVYDEIYNTYPATGGGREIIYTFLDQGNSERADEMLENEYFIERYEPVTLSSPPTWTEDPFGERYWRFIFYSLRPTRHLLAQAVETNEDLYFDKIHEVVGSFLVTGMDKPHTWDDPHGAAFRTMVLVNTWWKLREMGKLNNELSDNILAALEQHGDYLLDPQNYEEDNNHAITQAAALLVLSHSFPDLDSAPIWSATAKERISVGLEDIIDEDGVLTENSPYYHFYVLEKYWEIYKYAQDQEIVISDTFNETIAKMIAFSTYVLQPDLDMPLLGASISREISPSGEFREIAEDYSMFNYVMTGGEEGDMPEQQYIYYPSSGIALLRSGWGTEREYVDETFILFDTGPYRTDHSDLDVLTFSAYADGTRIIRDAGLFTYETDHPLYEYFHGTRGHNTVIVDNNNQVQGTGYASELQTGEEYAYLAAWHNLYPDVRHSRTLMLIEDGAILIIDELLSDSPHTYEQLFHLSENAQVTTEESTQVEGHIEQGNVPFSITQFADSETADVWHYDEEIGRGLCANAYEILAGCHEISFTTNTNHARYITLVSLGESGTAYEVTASADNTFHIETPKRTYTVAVEFPSSDANNPFISLDVETGSRGERDASFFDRFRDFINGIF